MNRRDSSAKAIDAGQKLGLSDEMDETWIFDATSAEQGDGEKVAV